MTITLNCDKCHLRLFDYDGPLDRGEPVRRRHLTNPHPGVADLVEFDVVACPECGNLYGTFSLRVPIGRVPAPSLPSVVPG